MVRKLVTVIDGRIVPELETAENGVKPLTGEERADMSNKIGDRQIILLPG
jgi:hypothetical protein